MLTSLTASCTCAITEHDARRRRQLSDTEKSREKKLQHLLSFVLLKKLIIQAGPKLSVKKRSEQKFLVCACSSLLQLRSGSCIQRRATPSPWGALQLEALVTTKEGIMNQFQNTIAAAVLLSMLVATAEATVADHTSSIRPNRHTSSQAGIPLPSTCNAGCIPEHVKLKEGRPNCCNEGHETLKCPSPAHYQCGPPSPPPSPPTPNYVCNESSWTCHGSPFGYNTSVACNAGC
eukprot:gene20501-17153_t